MHDSLHPPSVGRFHICHSSAAQIKNSRSEWRLFRSQTTVVTLCDAIWRAELCWYKLSSESDCIGRLKKVKKVAFWNFFNTGHLAHCILAPNKFPHSSPEAPHIIHMHETSTSEGVNYYQILLANSNLRKSARIFYMPQSWDMRQILLLLLRRRAYWGFSGHPKNPTASAGFEPPNWGSSGQYANHQTTEAV